MNRELVSQIVYGVGSLASLVTALAWVFANSSFWGFAISVVCFCSVAIFFHIPLPTFRKSTSESATTSSIKVEQEDDKNRTNIFQSPFKNSGIEWHFEFPAQEKGSQSQYMDAMISLEVGRGGPAGARIAEAIREWVMWQYNQFVERYPGGAGQSLKERYFVKAFENLKGGKFSLGPEVHPDQIQKAIRAVEAFVAHRVYYGV